MSAIICESFDWYGSAGDPNTYLSGKWTEVSGWSNVVGRNGRGVRAGISVLRRALSATEQDDLLIIGLAFRINATISGSTVTPIFFLTSDVNATVHCGLRANANAGLDLFLGGSLGSGAGGATIASTPNNTLQANQFQYIEAKIRLSDSTLNVEIRVDGQLQTLSVAGPYDTKNGGTMTVFDNVVFRLNQGSATYDVDDIVVMNEQGSRNNDFLGDVRIEALLPNGNGNASQLAGSDGNSVDNYLLVDEQPPNDDTDYVESDVDNQKDTYAFSDLASSSGSVAFVQATARAKRTSTGARTLALLSRLSGSEVQSSDLALGTTYGYARALFELEPDGVSAWTRADVNAAEFGVKVRP